MILDMFDICFSEVFPDGTSYSGQYMKKGESIAMHGDGFLQSGPETFEDRNLLERCF